MLGIASSEEREGDRAPCFIDADPSAADSPHPVKEHSLMHSK